MQSLELSFRPLTEADLTAIAPWFLDEETARFLGGVHWPKNSLALASENRHVLLACAGERAVALVDVEVISVSVVGQAEPERHGHFALVVDPELRRQGYARRVVAALLERPDLCGARLVGGVHADNAASRRLVESLDFTHFSDDADGYAYYGRATQVQ